MVPRPPPHRPSKNGRGGQIFRPVGVMPTNQSGFDVNPPPRPPAGSRQQSEAASADEKATRTALLQKAQNFKTFIETLESESSSDALEKTINGESFMYLRPVDGNVYHFQAVGYDQIDPVCDAGLLRLYLSLIAPHPPARLPGRTTISHSARPE